MSDRNSVSAYKSRNRHLLNRIRDVLASMQEEAQSCGIPFDPEVATYIWALFHYSYVKDRNPAHFAKPKVQS
jgi:hypothetical protein